MLRVGLTGGIGSGKSTVAEIFSTLGVPVYYADSAAKKLMNENSHLKKSIIQIFGDEAYANGLLDRKFIASKVFDNSENLAKLNSIVHPVTLKDAAEWMTSQESLYVIKEAAIFFEAGAEKDLDFVIGVSAPKELRIERVMKRDRVTKEEVLSRMSRQMNEEEKMQRCDFVIINDEQQLILPQVIGLHEKLILMSEETIPRIN